MVEDRIRWRLTGKRFFSFKKLEEKVDYSEGREATDWYFLD